MQGMRLRSVATVERMRWPLLWSNECVELRLEADQDLRIAIANGGTSAVLQRHQATPENILVRFSGLA